MAWMIQLVTLREMQWVMPMEIPKGKHLGRLTVEESVHQRSDSK